MNWLFIPFFIFSAIGSLFSMLNTASSHRFSDGEKIFGIFIDVLMLIWAIVLIVLMLYK